MPEYYDPLGFVRQPETFSFDLEATSPGPWGLSFSPEPSPPSYDPMSPSYDPCAASPCNPFPTFSPFAPFTFARSTTSSGLSVEDQLCGSEATEYCTNPSPVTQPRSLPPPQAAAIYRVPPPHSAPSLRRTKPCRFYLDPVGCKSGRWCNFKHPLGANDDDCPPHGKSGVEELRAAIARFKIANEDTSLWDDVPDVRDIDPNWGKKNDGEVHPKWRTQPCRNFLLGLCRYGDKCQFIHAPAIFPPAKSDVSHPYPPFTDAPAVPPISLWDLHSGIGVAANAHSSYGVMNAKPEQMSLYYRTKPCKYFNIDGTCPHGESCKFIHDPKKSAPPSSSSSSHAPSPIVTGTSWADDDRELDLEEMPRFAGIATQADWDENSEVPMHDMTNGVPRSNSMRRRERARKRNTSSDSRKKDDQQSGGIFKPTWRVVGGGVMLAKSEKRAWKGVHVPTDDNDDAVLDFQPSDSASSSSFDPTSQIGSPTEYLNVQVPFGNNSPVSLSTDDYYATFSVDSSPSQRNELVSFPPRNEKLHVAMGDSWNPPQPIWRKGKCNLTGEKAMMNGVVMDLPCGRHGNERPPTLSKERERQKPHLTIAVPGLSKTQNKTPSDGPETATGYVPYPSPRPWRTGLAQLATCTDDGDDILDWGDDDDGGDAVQITAKQDRSVARRTDAEEIRRVQSTPPTPCSGASYLNVLVVPRFSAESP